MENLIPSKDLGRTGREVAVRQQGAFPADDVISDECLHGRSFPLAQQAVGRPGRGSREGTTPHQQLHNPRSIILLALEMSAFHSKPKWYQATNTKNLQAKAIFFIYSCFGLKGDVPAQDARSGQIL